MENPFPISSFLCHDVTHYTTLTTTPHTMETTTHFTDVQIAAMLGVNPVTVRKWRGKNKVAGCIKFGPPYEYRGPSVRYPVDAFRSWCGQVRMVDGVPRINLPITAIIALPQQPTVTDEQDAA